MEERNSLSRKREKDIYFHYGDDTTVCSSLQRTDTSFLSEFFTGEQLARELRTTATSLRATDHAHEFLPAHAALFDGEPGSCTESVCLNGGLLSGTNAHEIAATIGRLKALTMSDTLRLIHAGAAAADSEKNYGIVSVWKELGDKGAAVWSNLGGPRADQLEAECVKNAAILEDRDIYAAIHTMAWFPKTELGADKRTGWIRWKRRATTTRYLTTVVVDFDFHEVAPPSEEEMLALFNSRRQALGMPDPNIVQFSGRGVWAFWLLADKDGTPGVRARGLALDNWLNLQSAIVLSFGGRADQLVKDPARLTRVPGSINSKSGTTVRAYLLNLQRHTIEELSAILRVESRKAPPRKALSGGGKSLRHKAAGRARVACLLRGLDQILQHVWRGHIPQGHRRDFLWTYARVLAMNGYSKQTILNCVNTLATAAAPGVDPMDVQRLVISASKPWNWNRSFSYQGLFLKFGITPQSQALVTAWMRPRVHPAARRVALEEQRLARRANFDRSVARLQTEGLRRNEIAAQLECSVRSVASSLKRLGLTRHSVPRDVQSVVTLIGSGAKHPTALATEKFAHFGTHEQRRRQLIRKLDLVRAPVRTVVRALGRHGVVAGRMTVWRDQQAIQGEELQDAINSRMAPQSYRMCIDNSAEDQHAESN